MKKSNAWKIAQIAFLLTWGLAPFLNSFSNPRLKGLRVPDRLQLIAPGLCWGVAFGILASASSAKRAAAARSGSDPADGTPSR